jgi:hypothetical protein
MAKKPGKQIEILNVRTVGKYTMVCDVSMRSTGKRERRVC